MEGTLFNKYLRHSLKPQAPRDTERGQLMEYFCKKINPGRQGVRVNGRLLQPINMPRMGKILEQISTKDLYYLKRICDNSRIFSQRFFYELNPNKHGTVAADAKLKAAA